MNTIIKKKVTLMFEGAVYDALVKKVGSRKVGEYLSQLAKPHVVDVDIEASYKAMAKDKSYERDANAWVEGVFEDFDTTYEKTTT